MLTIIVSHPYLYVYRELTEADITRYIFNGYRPPSIERERNPDVYKYARGELPPRYPVPAIPRRVYISSDYVAVDILYHYKKGKKKTCWRSVYAYCNTDHKGKYKMLVPLFNYQTPIKDPHYYV
jgi:hypothetical protein